MAAPAPESGGGNGTRRPAASLVQRGAVVGGDTARQAPALRQRARQCEQAPARGREECEFQLAGGRPGDVHPHLPAAVPFTEIIVLEVYRTDRFAQHGLDQDAGWGGSRGGRQMASGNWSHSPPGHPSAYPIAAGGAVAVCSA